MALMRHTDRRLTMNIYTDPRIFDLAGAVEKLPALPDPSDTNQVKGTGTDDAVIKESGRSESVSGRVAQIGGCSAVDRQRGAKCLDAVNSCQWQG